MQLRKELDKWVANETRYITKFYTVKNYDEKRNIELFFKYEKDEELIEKKAHFGFPLEDNNKLLDLFLKDSNSKFHKILADHIEEHWEQDIFTYNPNHQDTFDIAYYPLVKKNQDNKVIITTGKRKGDQILSKDDSINVEVEKGNITIIGWSHQ